MTLKTRLLIGSMTLAERQMGRFMRAPDGHGDGDAGGDDSAASAGGDQDAGGSDDSSELTTEEQLDKEFGVDDSPAAEEDDGGEEEDDTEGSDGEEEEGDGESEEEESDDADPKPKGRNQERIDNLVKAQREAEADAAFWKRRAEELGANTPDAGESVTTLEEPDVSKYEFGEADLDYIKDKAKFDAKVEFFSEQAEARLRSEAASLEVKWTANVAKAIETYPDFDDVVVVGAKENKWHCPPVIALGIKDSDEGVHIAYKLAKEPALSEKLAKLSPLEQAREMGRMERDIFHARTAAPVTPKPKVNQSKAPVPPKKRVNGSGAASRIAADTDDFAAFERMADAKMRGKVRG